MDANTNKKTLSGVFVALLVGSVFATMALPSAEAANGIAVVDSGLATTKTLGNNTVTTNNITVGTLTFNSTYDLTITNMTGTAGQAFVLFRPAQNGSAATGTSWGASPFGNPAPASSDDAHIGMVNVTFPGVQLDAVGLWKVSNPSGSNVTFFTVSPVTNLVVTLSQNAFTYTTSNVAFTVTVSPLLSGETAALSGPGILPNTNVTGPSGVYQFSGPMPAVGTSTITASRDLNGDNLPEYTGSATFVVSPASLVKTDVTTSVLSGFMTAAKWNLTFPNTTGVFGSTQRYMQMNLSVTMPNGTVVSDNRTSAASGAASGLVFRNATAGGIAYAGGTWTYDAANGGGNFSFVPNNNWQPGTYSFDLWVNTVNLPTGDATDNMPNSEYVAHWTLVPNAPATVNLDLAVGPGGMPCHDPIGTIPSGTTLNKTCVLEASYTSGFPTAPGSFNANLTVTGDALGKHPGVTGIPQLDAFTTANVTLTGDVLPGWTVASYTAGSGIAAITGIVPTHVGGSISFNVNWQNTTTSAAIPINQGAVAAADQSSIVVDQTTLVSTTLKDEHSHAIFDGKMFWFNGTSSPANLGIGPVVVNTTGSGDAYAANLLPTSIGKLIGFGVIGQNTGSGDFRNFSYTTLAVVPAHDVNATIAPTAAWASVPTAYVLNATVADGRSLGTTAQIYLLNATQYADLADNGSVSSATALAAGGQLLAPYLNSANGVVSYNFTATLKPGDYWVYLCGNPAENSIAVTCATAKHDNNKTGALPKITVSAYTATFTPNKIADNPTIQNNASITVMVDAAGNSTGVNGTLYWDATANAATAAGQLSYVNITGNSTNPNQAAFAIPIVNGMGQFLATGFKQGDISFAFDPAPAGASTCLSGVLCATSLVNGVLSVVGPNIDVNPPRIPAGSPQTVTMTVKTLSGTPIVGINIRICGAPIGGTENPPNQLTYVSSGGQTTLAQTGCTGNVTTDASGVASNTVLTNANGVLFLYLNDTRSATNITVFSGLAISWTPNSPVANDTVTVVVRQIGKDQGGESGVLVNVTTTSGNNTTSVSGFPQTTGNSGQVVLSVKEGNYTVTATKAGFQQATAVIRVGPQPVVPPTPAATFNLSNLVAPATGTVGNAITVKVDVTNSGTADGTAKVILYVDDAQQDTKDVTVAKGSKETAAFSFAFGSAGPHTVTAKLVGGTALDAKTVTVSTPTTTTVSSSTTTTTTSSPTVSSSTSTTTSTVVSSTTPTPTPKVPGFEVVALIGALAAAMLVLRRRK